MAQKQDGENQYYLCCSSGHYEMPMNVRVPKPARAGLEKGRVYL